ncbi:hypothetical protein Dsin_007024 [Dipteronia sinensis]|uniref:Uncharacterized protein n=1 Tax=Dipteronia sinensis TaxID=43782 RepID=A0AAE0AZR2_9ROSI|nr:hypothetical protein Dsin_007024 [Dipteronia sinensis]
MQTRSSKSKEKSNGNETPWDLEVEVAKVIEKGMTLGVIKPRQNVHEEDVEKGSWNIDVESERKELWDFIVNITRSFSMPWCLGGDFNTVLDPSERKCGECNMGSARNFNLFISRAKPVKRKIKGWLNESKRKAVSVKQLQENLKDIDNKATNEGWSEQLRKERWSVLASLWKKMRQDDQMWRHKSRVRWLQEGNKNSRFFHSIANGRRVRNQITGIVIDGARVAKPHDPLNHKL